MTTWKIKILKLKKTPGDIINLHICTINDNHIWFLRYGVWQAEFFAFLDHFLPFYSPLLLWTQKIKISKQWEKKQKQNKNGRYYHFTNVYHKWQLYDVWFMIYRVQWTEFSVILDHFCLFTPLKPWKIKILKKWNKILEISSFYTYVPKIMIISYIVPEIWCMMDVILIFYFGLFFILLHLNNLKNQNFTKMKKRPGDIIMLHMCTKNNDHMMYMMYGSWNMVCNSWTDRWTDGKSDIQRWVSHLKILW